MADRVTFLTACYQQAHLLPSALDSALAQTHPDVEVIVVNDGSTDRTHEVASTYAARHPTRVRLIEQPNRGVSLAREAALAASTATYVSILDADDVLEPSMAARCIDAFAREPDADVVIGDAWLVREDGTVIGALRQRDVPGWPAILDQNPFPAVVATMARADAVRRVGGMAIAERTCEDWDLWARMIRSGMRFVALGENLGRYRMTAGGLTRRALGMLEARIALLERAAADDPRLAGGALRPAPPIDRDLSIRLRNAAVFHSLGLALAEDVGADTAGALLAHLAPGPFDGDASLTAFSRGIEYGLVARPPGAAASRTALAATLPLVELRLRAIGVGDARGFAERLRRARGLPS